MSGYMTGLAVGNGRRAQKNAEIADANFRAAKSWEEYARKLEAEVREWQRDAVASEAVARASIEAYKHLSGGDGPRKSLGDPAFDALKERCRDEVLQEWGLK